MVPTSLLLVAEEVVRLSIITSTAYAKSISDLASYCTR
jgi:hypothetical protein